jgi:iron(III) transport system ATP-binding protein
MYLRLQDLVKIFPSRQGTSEVAAVNHVSLDIEQGELITLLGPSGCGKTTTLRMIAGFEFPTQGSILLDGKPINMLPPHKRQMSMVFQSYAIFPHLNVHENVAYGLNVTNVEKSQIGQRVDEVLELVQLTGLGNRAPNQLSGGQQQRVALARALVMRPKVLLMDEPLSNLDAKLREQMRTEIRRIQKSINITSVYVTHDQVEAMTLSDRIVVMNQGIIEQVGPPHELYSRPASRFVADFIGRANFLDGRVIESGSGVLVVDVFGRPVRVLAPDLRLPVESAVTLVVRPEAVNIGPASGSSSIGNYFEGVVQRTTYLGSAVDYEVKVGGQTVVAQDSNPQRGPILPEGATARVTFLEDCLHVLPA